MFIIWKSLRNIYIWFNILLREEGRINPETVLKGETEAPFWLHLVGVRLLQLKGAEAKKECSLTSTKRSTGGEEIQLETKSGPLGLSRAGFLQF